MIGGTIRVLGAARRACCHIATELARAEMILCGLRDALVEASRDPEADCAQESAHAFRCSIYDGRACDCKTSFAQERLS